ncbi:MAG: hypothetical protein ABI777_07180 [Betaproteobacteria bacterium]
MALCAQVESPGHCGRRIEAEQLKVLPNLAVRDGDTLKVSLYPTGSRDFVDAIVGADARAYALWDYWSPVNAVVMFISDGERLSYAVLQRANGQLTALPAEPVLAPDRQHLAVADFCAKDCSDQITVWRIARDGIRKESSWSPHASWSDVTVTWKDGDVLVLEYTVAGEDKARTSERKLTAADWQAAGAAR